jgi:F-type H+-transporting ATPase subunit a
VLFRYLVFPKFTEEPKGLQNVMEICVEAVENFCISATDKKAGKSLAPYMFTVAIYLILSAATELFGLRAPTSDLAVTFSLGLITFFLLNYHGFKKLGLGGRLKSMGGAVPAMRPIMIPLKIVSDIAVPLSLACRLFGNMLGGMIVMELLKGALGGYAAGIPGVAGLYFNLFHPLIQAYIFITLSLTFIDEAMESPEEHKKEN